MTEQAITESQALEQALGGTRNDEQIIKDGAKVVLSQIAKLRNQLATAERATQHLLRTGKPVKDDDKIWRNLDRKARALLDGMVP